MIGTSPLEYAWVVTWVVILHSIGPLCVGYSIIARFLPGYLRVWKYLEYWAAIETVFYVLTYAYRKYYLESPAVHPPPLVQEERSQLFRRCFETAQDLTAFFSVWFLGAPITAIKRENIKEWLRWAFFNTATADPAYDDELETYVKQLETKLGTRFEPGRADVRSIRLTLDKVDALHRSLTWYLCILVVDILTHTFMYVNGFDFYRGSIAVSMGTIPPRPQALIATSRSPSHDMSYWYRPQTSQKELPVVFLHGIGVGLYPYMQLLKEVNMGRRDEDGNIGILAVEILSISSRITTPVPRREELCHRLRSILHHHGIDRFVLVSHSYGSVITTHLLKTPDLACRISSVILVDPVSILLHQPDVVYNFTIRAPKFANEWLLWYFGSKDMGVAHTLSRTFFWSQNILWKEDLFAHRATVFLSEKDSIVNARQVRRYLEDIEEHDTGQDAAKVPQESLSVPFEQGSLEVVWCPGLDHGQVFDLAAWRERLKLEILRKARYAT
ncbi:hypothetical protein A1O3_03033 [Capronia epimyces CBS 606.96]|uniref:AB hydrolase-1 domain-containing protein n=1 Tax=Capronia epimyces CBS 606.96 TaxID=1182542 RepID=W9YL58_9EURO|nr:uncharacterized protein A1O3_03033 [Capronia epimyces CBS 606.96]EXJ89966.1 hypothetical protein A1O3_03033 [Capronia epimyces CBS 606.96]